MANVQRGEVKITLDKERTLKFTLNSLIEVEDKLGYSLAEIGNNVSVRVLRTLLHAGLVHEDPELTEAYIGEYILIENMGEVQDALAKAMGSGKN